MENVSHHHHHHHHGERHCTFASSTELRSLCSTRFYMLFMLVWTYQFPSLSSSRFTFSNVLCSLSLELARLGTSHRNVLNMWAWSMQQQRRAREFLLEKWWFTTVKEKFQNFSKTAFLTAATANMAIYYACILHTHTFCDNWRPLSHSEFLAKFEIWIYISRHKDPLSLMLFWYTNFYCVYFRNVAHNYHRQLTEIQYSGWNIKSECVDIGERNVSTKISKYFRLLVRFYWY